MAFARRIRRTWRLRSRSLDLGERTCILGILNLTPDSFSDGGRFPTPEAALAAALTMLDEGADILDLGGESTRPGAAPLPAAEEQRRVLPVLRAILRARPSAVLSIDTWHAETARLAIAEGAEIVNDVSGHLWDPAMSSACADLRCGAILMHTRGRPAEWRAQPAIPAAEVIPLVRDGLRQRLADALSAGIEHDRLILDPGFGFGKLLGENLPLLAGLEQLQQLGLPLLAGVSRKSFLRAAVTEPATASPVASPAAAAAATPATAPAEALEDATTAANVAAILAGASLLRVHQVAPARAAAAVADRLLAAVQPTA